MSEQYCEEILTYPSTNRLVVRKRTVDINPLSVVKYAVLENYLGQPIQEFSYSLAYAKGWSDCFEEFRERIGPS